MLYLIFIDNLYSKKRVMKRVLLICTTKIGKTGITNVVMNYLRSFNTVEIKFDLCAINNPEQTYIDIVRNQGGNVYVIERLGKTVRYFKKLTHLIRVQGYDVVHIHTNSHTAILELLAAKIAKCPVRIVHSHNTTCKSVLLHRMLTPFFYLLYTHGLACGMDAGRWMFGNRPFSVINNGVDVVKFSFDKYKRNAIRKKLCVEEGHFLLGHVGMFNGVKNQQFVVEIVSELCKKNEKYRLVLIGDGEQRNKVEEITKNLNLEDKVFFTGNIDNVSDYLSAIDLIVMPSLYEGLPLALIEQQANGLKCVVSDTITQEVNKTGNVTFLSLNSPAEKWAEIIESMNNVEDREIVSQNAINDIILAGYSIREEAKKLEDYYKEIIK